MQFGGIHESQQLIPSWTEYSGPAELHEMLAEVDFLLCAAPLTPETHHMISDAEFKVMKPPPSS